MTRTILHVVFTFVPYVLLVAYVVLIGLAARESARSHAQPPACMASHASTARWDTCPRMSAGGSSPGIRLTSRGGR
jgi:hypothetical protein